MPTVTVRLTCFEALCLDQIAAAEWSRGQVIRELIHEAAKGRLRLSPAQRSRLARELIVRRRKPRCRPASELVFAGGGHLFKTEPSTA